MCGIVGAFLNTPNSRFPVSSLTEIIKHRGPDDEGYLLLDPDSGEKSERSGRDTNESLTFPSIETPWPKGARVIFGHRRLSIIDLTPRGHQPMPDASSQYWIVYNGEIYNYRELREELKAAGSSFRSESDTEVILEAYKRWGKDCLQRFNGMWAFVIWDSRKKILFAARDRFGVKPLYYAQQGKDFFFASEIKALLEIPSMKRQFSEEKIFDFLTFGIPRHDSDTFFSRIKILEPGCSLTVEMNGVLDQQRWYSFPPAGNLRYQKENAAKFLDLLESSIHFRLRSDVPVGSCLSGGLDSSSIVCIAAKKANLPLETFSACFDSPAYDEKRYVEAVVAAAKVNAHFVYPDGDQFWEEWQDLVYQLEEPVISSGAYSQWSLMREASKARIPVLLDGQGGDELLGGYAYHHAYRAASMMRHGNLNGLIMGLQFGASFGILAAQFLPQIAGRFLEAGNAHCRGFLRDEFSQKFSGRAQSFMRERGMIEPSLNGILRKDFFEYVLPSLLVYEDKNSMRFSIETRLPFLDYRLVEWVFSLGEDSKINGTMTKRILRESVQGMVPDQARQRKDKMGFETPTSDWLGQGRKILAQLFCDSEPYVAPWIKTSEIKQRIEKGLTLDASLWRIVALELWLRTFFFERAPAKLSKLFLA